jgi:uncharacterized membrane protein
VLYGLGRRYGSRGEALAACALLAVSYHHVWFSQNARGYTALAFFATLCAFVLLRGIQEQRALWFALYALFVALGAYTHLTLVFMAFAHAAICVWLTFGPARHRRIRDWRLPALAFAGGGALTLLLYLPMLDGVMWWYLERPSNLLGISTPSWALVEGLRVLALGLGVPPLLLLAAAGIGLAGVISYWRQDAVVLWVFLLPALATLAGALLARGTMYPRFFFYLAGLVLLLGVRGVLVTGAWLRTLLPARWHLPRQAIGYGMIAVVMVASLRSLSFNYSHPKQAFSAAIAYLEQTRRADEAVTVVGVSYAYDRYYQLPWQHVPSISELERIRAEGRPFWVIYMQPRYIERDAPGLVAAVEGVCSERRSFWGTVGGGEIHVCRVRPASPGGP